MVKPAFAKKTNYSGRSSKICLGRRQNLCVKLILKRMKFLFYCLLTIFYCLLAILFKVLFMSVLVPCPITAACTSVTGEGSGFQPLQAGASVRPRVR